MISIGCSGFARLCVVSVPGGHLVDLLRRCAAPPADSPRRYGRAPAAAAVRNTGRPDLHAPRRASASSRRRCRHGPSSARSHRPACPGIRRSISAAFGPMFWARAWQARCTVTPSGSGFRPCGRPSFFAMSTTYSSMSKVAAARRLHVRIVGHDQRPFEFQHQPAGGGERDDVVAFVDQLARVPWRPSPHSPPRAPARPAPGTACRSSRDRRPWSRRRYD